MSYAVEVTATAEAQITEAFWYIHERAPLNARHWLEGFYRAIESLEAMPHRCADAPEAEYLERPLKHHRFKSHRIIFRIDETRRAVQILHVRHSAMRAVGEPYSDDTDET